MNDQGIAGIPELETRVFLPSWWVRAYDRALGFGADYRLVGTEFVESGVVPAATVVELNALSVVLSACQQQICENGYRGIRIAPEKFLSDLQTAPVNRRIAMERVLGGLGGLRVVEKVGEEYRAFPIFESEVWRQGLSGLELYLELAGPGAEFILGYQDPYRQLCRLQDAGWPQDRWLLEAPPLSLWKSVWLDLQGIEQGILLQIEKKMQWASDWLHLDGVFESDLDLLFRGNRLPFGRSAGTEFAKRLKVLERLGRKLVDHGFFAGCLEAGLLNFDDRGPNGLQVGWQIARERLLDDEAWNYRSHVARFFGRRSLSLEERGWFSVLVDGLAVARQRQISDQLMPELLEVREAVGADPLVIGASGLLTLEQLFVEWSIRVTPGHPLPLPQELKNSEAGKFVSLRHREPTAVRFRGFVSEITDHPSYAEALGQVKFATVAAPVTQFTPEVGKWLKIAAVNKKKASDIAIYVEEAKPQLVFSRPEGAETSAEHSQPARPASQRTGEAASKMRKIALSELVRIRTTAPEQYEALKRSYMDSLADGERRLIQDVMRRLSAPIFEEHLKPQLIRYMIENPSRWGVSAANDGRQPT